MSQLKSKSYTMADCARVVPQEERWSVLLVQAQVSCIELVRSMEFLAMIVCYKIGAVQCGN